MGILGRLFGRRVERTPGVLATDADDQTPRIAPLPPTPTGRPLKRPEPTPTTRPIPGPQATAGTRSYRGVGGTPSTQRIHNPTRPGR